MFGQLLKFLRSDRQFLYAIKLVENGLSKLLAIAMLVVTIAAVFDLVSNLITQLLTPPIGVFNVALIQIFGLFLNVLIALEILENITAYLRKHVIQLELVIVTSLTAVARKIIIFDSKTSTGNDLIALALGILALSVSYLIVRLVNQRSEE